MRTLSRRYNMPAMDVQSFLAVAELWGRSSERVLEVSSAAQDSPATRTVLALAPRAFQKRRGPHESATH